MIIHKITFNSNVVCVIKEILKPTEPMYSEKSLVVSAAKNSRIFRFLNNSSHFGKMKAAQPGRFEDVLQLCNYVRDTKHEQIFSQFDSVYHGKRVKSINVGNHACIFYLR